MGALVALCACVLAPRVAHAGDPDRLIDISPRPADSDLVVLPYEYGGGGFLYSRDRGETFSALCSAMIKEENGDAGYIFADRLEHTIVTGDGHVLAGDTQGLWVDDGQLCNWQLVPELKGEWVMDLAHDPRDPDIVYGVLSSYMSDENGMFRRNADGSIERVGSKSSIKIKSLEVVERPDGGLRFYQTAHVDSIRMYDHDASVMLPDGGSLPRAYDRFVYKLRVSDDEGQTWVEHAIETEVGQYPYLEAVDPTDIDRLVMRLQRIDDPDTLMFVEQAGAVQQPWLEAEEIGGVVIESAGAVWVAAFAEADGVKRPDHDGVWRAEGVGAELSVMRGDAGFCIGLHGDELELCDRFDYGIADKATARLSAPALFFTLDRVHACEGVDVVAMCNSLFCTGRCAAFHFGSSPMCVDSYDAGYEAGCAFESQVVATPDANTADAGVMDAGAMDAGVGAASGSGCGCRALGAPRTQSAGLALFAGVLLAFRLMRRRTFGRPCSLPLR
jgi:hypothetical protein